MARRAVKPHLWLWRLRRQGTIRVSHALGADRVCTRAMRRCRQACALVSGWSEVLAGGRG